MRWFVFSSVPSLAFCTDEVGGGLNEGLVGVVHQLLRARHLRVEWNWDLTSKATILKRFRSSPYSSVTRSMSSRAAVMV